MVKCGAWFYEDGMYDRLSTAEGQRDPETAGPAVVSRVGGHGSRRESDSRPVGIGRVSGGDR
jgi:hypothetical protein